jgi:hypothetical protein
MSGLLSGTRVRLRLALCLATGLSSCVDNPLWRFDKYNVQGEFNGSTCRFTVNGRAVPPDTVNSMHTMLVGINDQSGVPLTPGYGVNSASCNGVSLSIVSPVDSFTTSGEYRVSDAYNFSPGAASAALWGPSVTGGLWPFGGRVLVEGYYGLIRLDSMDRHRVWARFQFVGKRHHGGE